MKTPLLLLAATLLFAASVAAQVRIETPRSGWRAADAQQRDFQQEVHYPASNVSALGTSEAARIRGQITGLRKTGKTGDRARRPATLVVDGIAMPLAVDDEGRFERPWSFGAGQHGVEVRAPDGSAVGRSSFFEAQRERVSARLRVVLNWSSDNTDLDLHVVSPDGQHVWYGQRAVANGGALDVDVTSGFGPEIYAAQAPVPGIYHVYVNYYGSGEQRDALSIAQLAIVQEEGTPREKQQVFRVPMRKPGELTLVRSFVVP